MEFTKVREKNRAEKDGNQIYRGKGKIHSSQFTSRQSIFIGVHGSQGQTLWRNICFSHDIPQPQILTPVLLPGKSHTRFLWQVTVHGVTNSRTQLSNFTFLSFSPSRAETQVLHEGSYLSIDGLVRNQPLLQFLLPCTQAHARSQRGQGLKQKN